MNTPSHPYDEILRMRVETEFNAYYGRLTDAVSLIDVHLDGRPFVGCNEAYARLHGYTVEELLGQPHDIIHVKHQKDDPSAWTDEQIRHTIIEKHQREGFSAGRALHVRRDGSRFMVSYHSRLTRLAGRELMLACDSYFSHAERTQDEKAPSEMFRRLSASLEEGMVLADPQPQNLIILDCNTTFASSNGYTREELIGQPLGDFSHEQNPQCYAEWLRTGLPQFLKDLKRLESISNAQFYRHREGFLYPVRTTVSLAHENGRDLLIYIVRKVDEEQQQRTLEAQRDQILTAITKKDELLSTLLKIVGMVTQQIPHTRGAIFTCENSGWKSSVAPELSPESIATLEEFCNANQKILFDTDLPVRAALNLENVPESGCLIVPIRSNQNLFGIFMLLLQRPDSIQFMREVQAIQQAVSLASIAMEQQRFTRHLEYQAEHDHLTGLPNRLLLEDRLQQALLKSERDQDKLAVLMLDLDGFKRVNDSLGHAAGDWLLQQVAKRLQNCVRRSDTVARLGGDEFTILLPELGRNEDAAYVAEKIVDAIQQPFRFRDHDLLITTSIGIAVSPCDGSDVSTLLRNADAAMYRAKHAGKNHFEFYDAAANITENFSLTHHALPSEGTARQRPISS